MDDLKRRTIHGGLARLGAQGASFAVRLGSLMVFARLLRPEDFGLVGMVTAITAVLGLLRDFGLSSAAVQRPTVSDDQLSTLFWLNVLAGSLLALLMVVLGPAIAAFYHEPRLVPVTAALASGFVFNAAGVQHGALLQRELRFTALAVISTMSLIASTAIALVMAFAGYGYWALVVMTIALPLINTLGCWLATRWRPGRPRSSTGIRAMMNFGGTLTVNSLVYSLARNFDKILLGRFWGVETVGIYGRAYQLITIPTENLNHAAGSVAFSALSRLQQDPPRLKAYFLKGYSLILTMTVPLTMASGVFADDIVIVLLGSAWKDVGPIFRWLAPTILAFAVVNPLGWLLISLGLVKRSLNMALVIGPFMIVAYVLGLPYGPTGVAVAYSSVMLLWIGPAIVWAVQGTPIASRDLFTAVGRPLASSLVAAGIAFGLRLAYGDLWSPLPRLVLETAVLFGTYAGLLWWTGQASLYVDILREWRKPRSIDSTERVSPVNSVP